MKSSKTFVMTAALILAANWVGAVGARNVDWPTYGGSSGFDRYSALDLINPKNVAKLKILWTRPALDLRSPERFPI